MAEESEVQTVEIEYLAWAELLDVELGRTVQSVLEDLSSKNWLEVCSGLNDVRRFGKFHPSEITSDLHEIVKSLTKSLNNPRSALLKTSLVTISDMFMAFGDKMVSELDDLLLPLLLKASQDKKFVSIEAEKALSSMSLHLSPIPVLKRLQKQIASKNAKIRAKAAVSIHQSASRLSLEDVLQIGLPFLLKMAGSQVSDQLPEAREAAKKFTVRLYKLFTEMHSEDEAHAVKEKWENLCRKELQALPSQAILKIKV